MLVEKIFFDSQNF